MTESKFPRSIGSIVSQLLSRRGYAQVLANDRLQDIINAEIGSALTSNVRVGNLKAGVLHVYATDSVTLQELTFLKRTLLKRLQREVPESKIQDLRFRIQS